MQRNEPAGYSQRILELAQKWRTETIEDSEYRELNAWFYALEEKELGFPIELTVDLVEKRIHEYFLSNKKHNDESAADAPPHPWHGKKSNAK